jgi:hypothetical protein
MEIESTLHTAGITSYNDSRVKKASNNDKERVFVLTEDEGHVTVIRTDSIAKVKTV